jgi:integrase
VPVSIRLQWLKNASYSFHSARAVRLFRVAECRLRKQGKRPKYPMFYDLSPLVTRAFATTSHPKPINDLLDLLLLRLRLVTLMRSVDVANLTWGIFSHEGTHFIQTVDKGGNPRCFSVGGKTLHSLLLYLHRHLSHPACLLFRYVNDPRRPLGAERLAKRLLSVMASVGIDTQVFKAHSLRGATATHLMARGQPKEMVQARGGWSSTATLDVYYNRLHQSCDWEAMLGVGPGEHDASRHSPRSAATTTKDAEAVATEDATSPATEEDVAALLGECLWRSFALTVRFRSLFSDGVSVAGGWPRAA